jgi:thiosulfate dehydrogenase
LQSSKGQNAYAKHGFRQGYERIFREGMMNWPVFTACTAGLVAILVSVDCGSGMSSAEPVLTSQAAPNATASDSTAAAPASPTLIAQSVALADGKTDGWVVPDIDKLPDDAWGRIVRFGRELTVATYAYVGPEVADPAHRFAGINMSCQNCHLEAGTKKFGLPFVGVFADFPQYRSREGEVGTLEDRINGCVTRSMNGRPFPVDSTEMKAFVAYIKFLSTGRPIGAKTPGRGSGQIAELTRPADSVAGSKIFAKACAACHGNDGEGKRAGSAGDMKGYEFPPLWGKDSFNDGAGMARLIAAANFIHSNMPNGTTYDQPTLSVEEAWDVAAYVDSMNRPQEAHLDDDFPVRTEKPADAGYPPYIDGFGVQAHKLGPFGPIRDRLRAIKKADVEAAKSPTK